MNLLMSHSEQAGEQHDAAEGDLQLLPSSSWGEIDFFSGSQDEGECLDLQYSDMLGRLGAD